MAFVTSTMGTGQIIESPFKPPWWLKGSHGQTLWPNIVKKQNLLELKRERIELSDGDFLDLEWGEQFENAPVVLILHGLEGSFRSHYAQNLFGTLHTHRLNSVLLHFRGCSGEPNRLLRRYHAGETGDLKYVIDLLKQRFPDRPLFVIGYSLGGNVLLKWLGETGHACPVTAACAISVPFDLQNSANKLESGFSKFYQWVLLRRIHKAIRIKHTQMIRTAPRDLKTILSLRSFMEFDDQYTAPIHGFKGAKDYYRTSSCKPYLKDIRVKTLVLHAQDDPFMSPSAVPSVSELSETVTLELAKNGGHVGFVYGKPWRMRFWLEERIAAFIEQNLRS